MSTIINASTTSGLVQTADTSGTLELQSNGTTKLTVSSAGTYGQLISGTVNAGGVNPFNNTVTAVDFTSIPSWVKRITIMFSGVSLSASANIVVQVGAGSVTSSGYLGSSVSISTSTLATTNPTSGFVFTTGAAAAGVVSGNIVLCLLGSNTWTANGSTYQSNTTRACTAGGTIVLGGTLDRVRITTDSTDTFDAGSINILYEG